MRIICTGLLGQYAFGGVTWDYLQYVCGFRQLGCDVWYYEDTETWPYDPIKNEVGSDCVYNVAYLKKVMEEFNLGDRWIYRNAPDGRYHGAITDEAMVEKLMAESDLLVNISGACWLRPSTMKVKRKAFLDGDPMFTQAGIVNGKPDYIERIKAHDYHFTFGENIGQPDCTVPTAGIRWRPHRQPIVMDFWPYANESPENKFTTVMNWASYKPTEFQGENYDQKGIEFMKFVDLPKLSRQRMVVAMGLGIGSKRPTQMLLDKGWEILEPDKHLPDHLTYRDFLRRSKAEWSIAKNGYVKSWSGWFSCRSACYLALGRPVVVQDTGWTKFYPHGEGLLSFRTLDEAVRGIKAINSDYERHRKAARSIAEKYFDARVSLGELLKQVGLD